MTHNLDRTADRREPPHAQCTLRLGPLPRAEAERLGARLRRALIGRATGAFVAAVRLEGAPHRFARLDGVAESIEQILEALRATRIRLDGTDRTCVTLRARGPARIVAGDLGRDPTLAIRNPGLVIATLNPGAEVIMAVDVVKTDGPAPAGGRAPGGGWIELKAGPAPVQRVAMHVDEATGGCALRVEIETDGTVAPTAAAAEGARRIAEDAALGPEAQRWSQQIDAALAGAADRPVSGRARGVHAVRALGGAAPDVDIPDLTDVQTHAFERFLQHGVDARQRRAQGLECLLRTAFAPLPADSGQLTYDHYELGPPDADLDQCVRRGRTHAAPLRVVLRRGRDGPMLVVDGGTMPIMTARGTFVLGGVEKTVEGRLQALEETNENDLATRRLLLVERQLGAALGPALEADAAAMRLAGEDPVRLPHLAAALRAFFFGHNRLLRATSSRNPLALIAQVRRVVQHGLSGRPGYDARGIHASHFGRLCLLETPEGEAIGCNLSLGILADVDEDGRLRTPLRRAGEAGGVEHLDAGQDAHVTIGDWRAGRDAIEQRYGGREPGLTGTDVAAMDAGDVTCRPIHPAQPLGASASLIPLVGHDDPNRALMGANMQKQAVALVRPEAPLLRTGMETRVAEDARMNIRAADSGVVVAAGADRIVLRTADGRTLEHRCDGAPLPAGSAHLCLRLRVGAGDEVARGDVLADGPASDGGMLALGANVLVGYLPWEGYNFEDAIVASDRLVRQEVFTSIKVSTFVATIHGKAGPVERLGRDHLPPPEAARLDADGLIRPGATVTGRDVLVGRVATADGGRRTRDTSLRMPVGQTGTVVDVEHHAVARGDVLEGDVRARVRVTVAARRPLQVGDKLANRHGAKGTVSIILPEGQMPMLPDGRALDLVLNPVGVPSRMNVGQLLETHAGLAADALGCAVEAQAFDACPLDGIRAMLAEADLPASGMLPLRDGRTGRPFDQPSTVGRQYVMKLDHMAADRLQARSVGPYCPRTQQPVRGRRRGGGQRLGLMETWALQAHGAARCLHEFLTIGSDDVSARKHLGRALMDGAPLPAATVAHGVRRLIAQLRGLCLDLRLLGPDGAALDLFRADAAIADAASATIGFAGPEAVRRWSGGALGALVDAGRAATFGALFGIDDGLGIRHLELPVPMAHPWATAAGAPVPPVSVLPILPASLRAPSVDALYMAVVAACALIERQGRGARTEASLGEAVARLIGDPATGGGLTAMLFGKRGWVTAALSGKTLDYSGRAVASPGPELEHDQCGLPAAMAKVLFEPAVLGAMSCEGVGRDEDDARRMLADDDPRALAALRRVAADRLVLLHRAPVLHRLGIQAFRPLLTDENVIRLQPLINRSLNADFDGDELDVYLPLSPAAQAEADATMRAEHGQMGPASGAHVNHASQEMVLGCHYATVGPRAAEPVAAFDDAEAVAAAFDGGAVHVHDPITLCADGRVRRTTVGRALFNRLLPAGLPRLEEAATGSSLRALVEACWHRLGAAASATLGVAIMRFGFRHATLSGLSLGMGALEPGALEPGALARAWSAVADLAARHEQGRCSQEQMHQGTIDHWWRFLEEVDSALPAKLAADRAGLNPLHLMLVSGARGNRHQARQLLALRGMLTAPDGRVLSTPILTSYLRGHGQVEYLAATFGARKGLADTALKTASAGFLYKRVMNAVQDVTVCASDCGTSAGVTRAALEVDGQVIVPLAERIVGRVACEAITLAGDARPVVRRGDVIDHAAAGRIAASGTGVVRVRSPLTCGCGDGVCARCYGLDLSTWQPVGRGRAVGVIAAQSIGEPLTQLTMRTFAFALPTRRGSAPTQGIDDSIVGGMPRLDQLLEAGRSPDGADTAWRGALEERIGAGGVLAAADHILAECQGVFRQQGVRIDDRHFEVVLRRMIAGGATIVGVSEAALSTADFIVAAASYGGVPALARLAACDGAVRLDRIRNCMAFARSLGAA